MKTKIYYLTRSFSPYQSTGGAMMRASAVTYLRELGWDVIVVMPNYNSREVLIDNSIIQIPFNRLYIQKLASLLERTGMLEDYLDSWVKNTFDYLKQKITKSDIVFSTCGGELGMIKLGSLLKSEFGCKFVINFRDPLNYGYMAGLKRDKKPHVNRERHQEKYMSNADLIVTSSQFYADILSERFPKLSNVIKNNYFGYIKKIDLPSPVPNKIKGNKLTIAYTGKMSSIQSPELLYKAWKKLNDPDVELYFIGNFTNYGAIKNITDRGVHIINHLPHDEYLRFMVEKIDIGFVSLVDDYFKACVPSKIYEYINLGLPVLGFLPDGDAKNIINDYNYGLSGDFLKLSENILRFKDIVFYNRIKTHILSDKGRWKMEFIIKELDKMLKNIAYKK